MKMASWNVQVPKENKSKLGVISSFIDKFGGYILVLAETDERIKLLNFKFRIESSIEIEEFNQNKKIFDHIGILANILL